MRLLPTPVESHGGVRLVVPPGVFRPISDSWLLARAARPLVAGARVLDLCSGSGAISIDLARHGAARVVAVDLSRRAVLAARLNARLNGVRVDARRGDLLAALDGERFDVIVSNPPYVPAVDGGVPARGRARAWDAGPDGRALLDRVLAQAPAALAPGGSLLVVHSSICGERATLARMRAAGLEPAVVARERGPLGPLMRARTHTLEARGLLPRGTREEEVLVVRGSAAAAPRDEPAPHGDQRGAHDGGSQHKAGIGAAAPGLNPPGGVEPGTGAT